MGMVTKTLVIANRVRITAVRERVNIKTRPGPWVRVRITDVTRDTYMHGTSAWSFPLTRNGKNSCTPVNKIKPTNSVDYIIL